MSKAKPKRTTTHVPDEDIKYYADWQRPWKSLVPPLHQGRFQIESTEFLSIHGDAPKNFLRVKDYVPGQSSHPQRPSTWPAYIAKVGSKWYPVESITEHLVTRIGQTAGVNIADSQLRIVGNQVRFLSRYFLRDTRERLVHGLDLFRRQLDQEMVETIAAQRMERDFYTFQTVRAAVEDAFPIQAPSLLADFVEMLAFDALIGNNDRHPANWGIIAPIKVTGLPRFAPIFDSARALFWNNNEQKVQRILDNPGALDAYIVRSQPQIGWDGWHRAPEERFDHFTLLSLIIRECPHFGPYLAHFGEPSLISACQKCIDGEFTLLRSNARRNLIVQCLARRQDLLRDALQGRTPGPTNTSS